MFALFFLFSLQLWPRIRAFFPSKIIMLNVLFVWMQQCGNGMKGRQTLFIASHHDLYSCVLNISQHATIILTLFQLHTYLSSSEIFSFGFSFSSIVFGTKHCVLLTIEFLHFEKTKKLSWKWWTADVFHEKIKNTTKLTARLSSFRVKMTNSEIMWKRNEMETANENQQMRRVRFFWFFFSLSLSLSFYSPCAFSSFSSSKR